MEVVFSDKFMWHIELLDDKFDLIGYAWNFSYKLIRTYMQFLGYEMFGIWDV